MTVIDAQADVEDLGATVVIGKADTEDVKKEKKAARLANLPLRSVVGLDEVAVLLHPELRLRHRKTC